MENVASHENAEAGAYVVGEEELLMEIRAALDDCFIGSIESDASSVKIAFPGGERFRLVLERI